MKAATGTGRIPWTTWAVRALVAVLGTIVLSSLGAERASGQSPQDSLAYSIHTTSADGAGPCTTVRTATGAIGVPTLVDVGGNALPDLIVTVVAVPGVGTGADVLSLTVAKLPLTAPSGLRASVEVTVTPDGADPGRIRLGYDGCENGTPTLFSATARSSDAQLAVQVTTGASLPSLRVRGSLTDIAADGQPTNTSVSSRLAPMPTQTALTVDILEDDAYKARFSTNRPTDLSVDYVDAIGAASTVATADVRTFPGRLQVDFDPDHITYRVNRGDGTLPAPVEEIAFSVTTVEPGEDTTVIDASLLEVPATATLTRTAKDAVEFVAPEAPIGQATVGFASFPPASAPPVLAPLGEQFFAAETTTDHTAVLARVTGLRQATIDAGDPIIIDLQHAAGPFQLAATVTDATQTRVVDGHVLDLPASAHIEFSPSTQAFAYTGSDEIGELDIEVTSSVPFVDEADTAHLLVRGFPTGLHGRLDAEGESFTATLNDGDVPAAVDLIEVQVTSGPDERLADGVDGVVIEDHVGSYAAFARIQGVHHVDVGWSDEHQYADVDHAAGPFHLRVDIDDIGSTDLEIDGRLLDLPSQARFDHIPGQPTTCPPGSTEPECETPLVFTFASDVPGATIGELTFDVATSEPLVRTATRAHLVASDLAPVTLTVDGTNKRFLADAAPGRTVGFVGLELCSPSGCGLIGPTGGDGVFLIDLVKQAQAYDAAVRIHGLRHVDARWGTDVQVNIDHAPGPFDVRVEEDRVVNVPNHPPGQPPEEPPCDLPKPRDCEILDEDEPPGPDTHEVVFRTSLTVAVRDLPAVVDLSYDPVDQHVDYSGSDPIGSLEAHYTDGLSLVGRARFAHLLAEGIPSDLDLVFQFDDAGEVLTADTGGGTLGFLALELLSANELLDPVYQSPGFRDGFDGLVFWDLSDNEGSAVEPIDDAYAIAVRATGVQHFEYQRGPSDDGTFAHNRVAVDLRRSGRTPLWVEVQKNDQTRPSRTIPGLGTYRAELINLDYANPPEHLGFEFDERTRGVHTVYDLRYYGSSTGDWVRFISNIGDGGDYNPLIDFTATPVPGGGDSLAAPGVLACIGPNNMRCSDVNEPAFDTGQFSVSLFVTEPMTLNGRYDGGDQSVRVSNLTVEHALVAGAETNNDGVNSTAIYVDTRDGTVSGTLRVVEKNFGSGNDDTQQLLVLPPGFMAYNRHVEMENVGTGFSRGRAVCPAGMLLTHEAIGIDVNLEDRFCPNPRIDAVTLIDGSPAVLTPGTHQLVVAGTNFVPWIGNSVGTLFAVGDFLINPNTGKLTIEEDIAVTATEWLDISTVRLTVTVSADTDTGTHDLTGFNPSNFPFKHATCADCITVVEP